MTSADDSGVAERLLWLLDEQLTRLARRTVPKPTYTWVAQRGCCSSSQAEALLPLLTA